MKSIEKSREPTGSLANVAETLPCWQKVGVVWVLLETPKTPGAVDSRTKSLTVFPSHSVNLRFQITRSILVMKDIRIFPDTQNVIFGKSIHMNVMSYLRKMRQGRL